MNDVIKFPGKDQQSGKIVITILGHWNGPLFYFEVTSGPESDAGDPRIAITNNFDGAFQAAHGYACLLGYKNVRFALTSEDMHGGVA